MEYELVFVLRGQNTIANKLACLASSYPKTPADQQIIIQTKFKSAVPDNENYWQVFEGDKQIEYFLTGRNEFEFSGSDSKSEDNRLSEESSDEESPPCSIEINSFSEETGNSTTECENADS